MATESLPDHYKALGVDRKADAATIKATYRKLVLKCHPDKVTDPALKEQKQEEFHKIQQAYEVLVDAERRGDYEARLSLEALKKENAARRAAASSSDKTARFDVPTRGGATMRANGPSRYSTEERKPSRAYDDDDKYYEERGSSRSKYDTYPAYPKGGSSPQSKREKESSTKSGRTTSDRTRSDRNKTRDREERKERKFNSVEDDSSADEKARYEAEYKRRSAEDDIRRQAAEARRKAEERRSYEDARYPGAAPAVRKMSAQEEQALRYQHKSRAQVEEDIRPSPVRSASRDDYYESSRSSRKESRPETARRSSAVRPKERTPISGRDRERGIPEIVDWGSEKRPASMKHSSSSPAEIEIPRLPRAYTDLQQREQRSMNSPPTMHRSATMPTVPHASSSSRRKESTVRPSGLRETMTPEHSTPEHDYPSVPQPQSASASKTKYYHYPAPSSGAPLRAEEVSAGGHRTVLREPERKHHRSPSPLSRPPIGVNRPSEANIKTTRPSMPPRTSSSRNVSPVRGRSERPLYGEVRGEHPRVRHVSYSPDEIQYGKRYGPEDVRWAPRGRENEREYAKPTFNRTATWVH